MEASGQIHALTALFVGKQTSQLIESEAVWAKQL
jgi:hypothetical protein